MRTWNNLVIDDGVVDVDEDTNAGTTIKVRCPTDCLDQFFPLSALPKGTNYYSDDSSVCLAAQHAGVITENNHGLVQVTLERSLLSRNSTYRKGSLRNVPQILCLMLLWLIFMIIRGLLSCRSGSTKAVMGSSQCLSLAQQLLLQAQVHSLQSKGLSYPSLIIFFSRLLRTYVGSE